MEKFCKYKPYKDCSPLPGSDFEKLLSRTPGEDVSVANYENTGDVNFDGDDEAMAIFGYQG